MRPFFAALLAACAFAAHAEDWLDSPQAAEFRERVVQLALIYGESSGIDLEGYKVTTREVQKLGGVCSDVEVVTSRDGKELRRETVRACRQH